MTRPAADLLAAGAAALDALGGGPWRLATLRHGAPRRPHARLTARATGPGGRTAIVKVHADPARAAGEAEALASLAAHGVRIAPLLHHDAAAGALVLPDLGDRALTGGLDDAPARAAALGAAGDWLAAHLRVLRGGSRPWTPVRDARRLRSVLAAAPAEVREAAAPLAETLPAWADAIAGTAPPCVPLHGDLKPDNLICASDGLVAIDPIGGARGLPEEDAVALLRGASLVAARARRAGRAWPEGPSALRRALVGPALAAGLVRPARLAYVSRTLALYAWVKRSGSGRDDWQLRWMRRRCAALFAAPEGRW